MSKGNDEKRRDGADRHLLVDELEPLGHVDLGLLLVLLNESGADELENGVVGFEQVELLATGGEEAR